MTKTAAQQTFRAGLIQMRSGREPSANLDAAVKMISEAKKAGADYVQTPEMTNIMEMSREKLFATIAEEEFDICLTAFRDLARKLSIYIHVGSLAIKVSPDKAANRGFLIDPKGEIVARYDKIHMFDVDLGNGESYRELRNYRAGELAVVTDLPWARFGISVCYDLRFPSLYRALAEAGASVLTIPSAFTRQTGEAHSVSPFSSLAMKPCEIQTVPGVDQRCCRFRIGIVGARRREIGRAHAGVAPLLGLDDRARIDPLHIETLRRQECGAEPRRHQLALRQHAGAQALAHLADQRDAGSDLPQTLELLFELRAGNDAEVACQVAMALLDLLHDRLPLVAEGETEQLFEPVGDAGQSGMDDDGSQAFGQPVAQDRRRCFSSLRPMKRWCRRTSGRPTARRRGSDQPSSFCSPRPR